MDLSVVICTYNPNLVYLFRVIDSLKCQTLNLSRWELLIIDNNSDIPLQNRIDISWHPHAQIYLEKDLGLTKARVKGISKSKTELLVFVDDDNILSRNYLEKALEISKNYPNVGVWGGQTHPEFEVQPPFWTKPYWTYLAIREFNQDIITTLYTISSAEPCGAGICVRRKVADKYLQDVKNNPLKLQLDRKGKSLTSGGDTDIAFTACDMGLAMGVFKDLHLTHVIPAFRLTEDYLLSLMQSLRYSHLFLRSFRNNSIPLPNKDLKWWIKHFYRLAKFRGRARKFYIASVRAENTARQLIRTGNEFNKNGRN